MILCNRKFEGINNNSCLDRIRFATHLLVKRTDLRFIQELLGHRSSKTTEIFTNVNKKRSHFMTQSHLNLGGL